MGGRFLSLDFFKSFFFVSVQEKKNALFDITIFTDGKESKPLLSVDEKGKVDWSEEPEVFTESEFSLEVSKEPVAFEELKTAVGKTTKCCKVLAGLEKGPNRAIAN